jgi:hypothetical protein
LASSPNGLRLRNAAISAGVPTVVDRMSDCRDVLATAIRRRRAILFVGAGLSMAVGLPYWEMLVEHLLEDLQLDRKTITA